MRYRASGNFASNALSPMMSSSSITAGMRRKKPPSTPKLMRGTICTPPRDSTVIACSMASIRTRMSQASRTSVIRQHQSHAANDTLSFRISWSDRDSRGRIMPSRINSELLLVGSLPASSTEEALRAGGELFGDLVFALPDGETGPRALWAAYEYFTPAAAPPASIDVVRPGGAPPRHVEEIPVLGVQARRRGAALRPLAPHRRRDRVLRVFRALRDEGVIPPTCASR